MKKALEIAQNHRTKNQRSVRFKRDLANDIKEYARQACEEQRKICSELLSDPWAKDDVLRAKEPDLK